MWTRGSQSADPLSRLGTRDLESQANNVVTAKERFNNFVSYEVIYMYVKKHRYTNNQH